MNPDGTEKWIINFHENNWYGFPSIASDGTIILSGNNDCITALNPEDGSLKWKFETGGGVYGPPAIDKNGILYFGSYDKILYSLNPDGTERWRITTDGGLSLAPTIDSDGTVYFGGWDNYLYAIDGEASEDSDDSSDNDLYVGEDPNKTVDTPGFEIIITLLAISLIIYFNKKRK